MIPVNYSVRNLWVRRRTTFVTVLGIALVVFVFVAALMLSRGVTETLKATGSPTNALIVRKAAQSEIMSAITRENAYIITSMPQVASGPDGKPAAAAELVVLINLGKKKDNLSSNVVIRGVSPASLSMRKAVHIIAGRMWNPGSPEIIVGSGIARNFKNCEIGNKLRFGERDWNIVGIFDANNTGFQSEIWGDVELFMLAFGRPVFSSATVTLSDPSQFETFRETLESDSRLTVKVWHEREFYEKQSEQLAGFIKGMGIVVTVIFSIGAMIGAMITMYGSVSTRTREIGTLRAIGYSRFSVLIAFLLEGMVLCLAGGLIGVGSAALLSYATFSTTNFSSFAELEFGFSISPMIAVLGILFALIMGVVGGFFPSVRAASLKIVDSLRNA